MHFRALTTVLFSVALFACQGCSDSDGDEPQEQSGVFQAGASGVSYQTATRHGVTDAAGTFHYMPGETVTFFIGGTVLGSAPGTATITPFTLAGLTPPTTELALRRELDRTRRMTTPLGRAINMATLLLALDADGNAANGIDVGPRSSGLTRVNLEVGQHIGAFTASMYKNISGLTASIPVSQSLAHLYRAVNVLVPAHVNTRAETATSSGFVIPHEVRTATYAPDGRRLTVTADFNDDGQDESSTVWGYDARGRLVETTSRVTGSLIYLPVYTLNATEFDANGYRVGVTFERHYDGDDTYDAREVTRFENDEFGFVTLMHADTYLNGGDVVASSVIQRYTYDARHNVTRYTFESDLDADGVFNENSVGENEYDALNRPLSSTDIFDSDGDGVVDSRQVTTYEYGVGAGATREVSTQDDDDDGTLESQSVITRTFDAAGNLLLQLQEHDTGLDGTIDAIWRSEFTYDGQRRVLSQSTQYDYDADGVADSWSNSTSSFDAVGNLLVATLEQGAGSVDILTLSATNHYEYGASGELLELTSEVSLGGQIQPLQDSTTTVTSDVLADGVLALGQEYFENFGNLLSRSAGGGVMTPIFSGGLLVATN